MKKGLSLKNRWRTGNINSVDYRLSGVAKYGHHISGVVYAAEKEVTLDFGLRCMGILDPTLSTVLPLIYRILAVNFHLFLRILAAGTYA